MWAKDDMCAVDSIGHFTLPTFNLGHKQAFAVQLYTTLHNTTLFPVFTYLCNHYGGLVLHFSEKHSYLSGHPGGVFGPLAQCAQCLWVSPSQGMELHCQVMSTWSHVPQKAKGGNLIEGGGELA